MKFISTHIQNGYLHRVGIRGRWLTVYWHRYGGRPEKSERFHQHPWRWVASVLLWGWFDDHEAGKSEPPWARKAPSLRIYPRRMRHRVLHTKPGTMSLFIGFDRTQESMPNATVKCPEGYCHYTELSGQIDEPQSQQ